MEIIFGIFIVVITSITFGGILFFTPISNLLWYLRSWLMYLWLLFPRQKKPEKLYTDWSLIKQKRMREKTLTFPRLISPPETAGRKYIHNLGEFITTFPKKSLEFDDVLIGLQNISNKTVELKNLEQKIASLIRQENELKEKMRELQNVPSEVAAQFIKLLRPLEYRSNRSAFTYFFLGVVINELSSFLWNFPFK